MEYSSQGIPLAFFSILGVVLVLRNPIPRFQLIILAEISFVSTRLPHYAPMLYPFMAMLAAVALNWLGKIHQTGDL